MVCWCRETELEVGQLVGELDREAMARAHDGTLDALRQLDDHTRIDDQRRVVDRCSERGLQKVALHMKPSDCVIWHPQLLHGGTPIRDASLTRLIVVRRTASVGLCVYQQHVFFHPS